MAFRLPPKDAPPSPLTPEQETRQRRLFAAKRLARVKKARDRLLDFTCLTMPDPADVNNPDLSKYTAARHHEAIAASLEKVLSGEILRLIITCPPRHGKSELSSRRFPAFVMGHHPDWEVIFGTYNDTVAMDFGEDVRDVMRSPGFRQIFPQCSLKKGSQNKEKIETTDGGCCYFVGRGSSMTSRGADILIIDDPLKGRKEADSPTIREDLWKWFNDDAYSRLKNDRCRVIVIQTRWHEDDLIGRLTDPNNPHFDPEEAAKWTILDLPSLAGEHDPLGRPPGEALWPEKFGAPFLQAIRRRNPRGFASLYQGRPTPEEGNFFQASDLSEYGPADLPPKSSLRFYAASDHAVSTKQENDKTCLMPAGVDEYGTIWIMPQVVWRRMPSDQTVDEIFRLMKEFRFLTWWAEDEHIGKAIGPFLRKRMYEENVYVSVRPLTTAKDKMTKAQAIQGRTAQRKVRFPRYADWWPEAKTQLLTFPNATHDDFVDALANLGRGLDQIVPARVFRAQTVIMPPVGTIHWIKKAAEIERKRNELTKLAGGF